MIETVGTIVTVLYGIGCPEPRVSTGSEPQIWWNEPNRWIPKSQFWLAKKRSIRMQYWGAQIGLRTASRAKVRTKNR